MSADMKTAPQNAVEFNNVSIVFGDKPERALPLMDAGKDRAEIEVATGQVLGVHNCSLDVKSGEILVLMGLSGSGKSTLLRAVNGLNPMARGTVRVNDGSWSCDIAASSATDLRRVRRECVSMVFQQFGLLPWRSVRDNVALGLELADVPKAERYERADRQLALVGLSDWADRKVGELSGGMQQRVGLARAFATEAPILLMDEPFSALDPLIRTRRSGRGVQAGRPHRDHGRRAYRAMRHPARDFFEPRIALCRGICCEYESAWRFDRTRCDGPRGRGRCPDSCRRNAGG